ncbi:MAG: sigma factor-like helix-turn-helix DNA-binding protein [Micropruina sp.]|uniref:RNA polymerase sigma factor n=1 Tax=Micropruina sp. TaxID=2737536 RepID=UPI0039E6FB65
MTPPAADTALADLLREQSGRLVMRLSRVFGDFALAEDAVAAAVVEALVAWRRDGVPPNPAGWLALAARRNALDAVRRRGRTSALPDGWSPAATGNEDEDSLGSRTDDRLGLLFACCHPALAIEVRIALTLRAVTGLTTAEVARAFLVNEATLAQRIVRAKRKIVAAGIALDVPDAAALPARLSDVRTVIYACYNEAFVSTTGTQDRVLGADALWLAELVAHAFPDDPENWGLAALLATQHARAAARFTDAGDLVPLRDQDRRRWDADLLEHGRQHLYRAAAARRPGPLQLQAAIAAVHGEATTWAETDWAQIVGLYDLLRRLDPSPVVRLNRAVALAEFLPSRTAAALAELDALAEPLAKYHPYHAARAELLRRLGRPDEAEDADLTALRLTQNDAERRLLRSRLRRGALSEE